MTKKKTTEQTNDSNMRLCRINRRSKKENKSSYHSIYEHERKPDWRLMVNTYTCQNHFEWPFELANGWWSNVPFPLPGKYRLGVSRNLLPVCRRETCYIILRSRKIVIYKIIEDFVCEISNDYRHLKEKSSRTSFSLLFIWIFLLIRCRWCNCALYSILQHALFHHWLRIIVSFPNVFKKEEITKAIRIPCHFHSESIQVESQQKILSKAIQKAMHQHLPFALRANGQQQ